MKTLIDNFYEHAERAPDRPAVHHRGRDWTYAHLAQWSDRLAGWLVRMRVRRGDRVAMLLPNSAEYVASYLGILRAGAIAVALNPDTTERELLSTFASARPVVAVAAPRGGSPLCESPRVLGGLRGFVHVGDGSHVVWPGSSLPVQFEAIVADSSPRAELPDPPRGDDVAQIIYTSGTTGRPKGVTLSHKNIAANCRSIVEYLQISPSDSVLAALPFFYSYGNSLLFTHLAAGGRLVIAADTVFWNRLLDLMERQQVTGLAGVPSTFAMLLRQSNIRQRALPQLRYITCAGGALPATALAELRRALPHVAVFPMYGQTEATARLSTLLPSELDERPGSIGRGIAGVSLRVINDHGQPVSPGETGEIVAAGDNVMLGYWDDKPATREVLRPEGLRTGDLARADEDGYIYIVGRKSDIIKSGSYRIHPQEIEEAILALEGVAEAAVVGRPDETWGEAPVAFVVPAPSASGLSGRDVLEHCRRLLPRYKRVREVRLVKSLPKTPSGKVLRSKLRDAAAEESVE